MVKLPCPDVLRTVASAGVLDFAIIAAVASAAVSWLDPSMHGSVANNSLLNAAHWLILFMLAAVRVSADGYIKTDVEITWMLFGFILGEVDADNAASIAFMVLSAACFQRHRRQQRLDEQNVELAEPSSETAEF